MAKIGQYRVAVRNSTAFAIGTGNGDDLKLRMIKTCRSCHPLDALEAELHFIWLHLLKTLQPVLKITLQPGLHSPALLFLLSLLPVYREIGGR